MHHPIKQWKVGIFLFNEVEVLDFAGPFEAFSLTMLPAQKEKQDAIITAGGVSAGINMSLHIIERLLGSEIALATAKRMEYDL